jgi:hypothetical protein
MGQNECNDDCMTKKKSMSLTPYKLVMGCVMRLHGKEKIQCHSLPVGHGVTCNESVGKKCTVAHILLDGGWNVNCNETILQRKNAVPLTNY